MFRPKHANHPRRISDFGRDYPFIARLVAVVASFAGGFALMLLVLRLMDW